jgi:dolichol-phosphate mannosyltransferase
MSRSPSPAVAVVTPTYNEGANVRELIGRIRAAVPGARVYVVDDGSPDGTGDAVEGLAAGREDLVLLRRAGKAGLASAYALGFGAALADGAERVVQMDADLSHDPADLPRLLAPQADLVLGSRYVPGGGTRNWPLHRRLLSRGGSLYARLWLGLPWRDLTGGFKAWRADTLRAALREPVRSEGYVFQVEMTVRAARAGARIEEVPIVFTERAGGVSKMSRAIAVEAALGVPRLRAP